MIIWILICLCWHFCNTIIILAAWYNLFLFISQNIPTAPRLEPLVSFPIELELILLSGKVCKLIMVMIHVSKSIKCTKLKFNACVCCDIHSKHSQVHVNEDKSVMVKQNKNLFLFFLS